MKNYICGTQSSDPDYIKSYEDRNFQNKYINKNYSEVTLLATFKLHTLEELCHTMCFLVLRIEPRTLYMLGRTGTWACLQLQLNSLQNVQHGQRK